MSDRQTPQISVIMPTYNSRDLLAQTLPPLLALKNRMEVEEIIVVDDASTDGSGELAARLGAEVVHHRKRKGPAAARNLGAQCAKGAILWFVDADVIVHDDAAKRISTEMTREDISAIFGSYDDKPLSRNFASQYKNLLHHYHHQNGRRLAQTFWGACGAIYKKDFLAIGGFDATLYNRPSVEDIELGYRMHDAGLRILLQPGLKCTHLKTWSLGELVREDIFHRAIPWSRQLCAREKISDDLNVSVTERLKASLAWLLLVLLSCSILFTIPWWLPSSILAMTFAANARLFAVFQRRNGFSFATGGLLYHQLYYLYSSMAFGICWLEKVFSSTFLHKNHKRISTRVHPERA